MHKITLFILAAVLAVAYAEGQYYVPRAYYTIDAEGHESARVPLRRLRRSMAPYPYSNWGSNANADAEAHASGGGSANAHARADAGGWGNGGWNLPSHGGYGASNPGLLKAGSTLRQYGPVSGGRSVSASSSVGVDSLGNGYYDQSTSVN